MQNSSEKIHLVKGSHHRPKITGKLEEQLESQKNPETSVQHVRPSDSSVAGNKESSQKKALAMNATGKQTQRHPDTPAGQHATGSFTGTGNAQDKP